MNSFRRFLLSYLCILLLPIIILSFVISNVIRDFCMDQLLEQKWVSLRQLDDVMELQREKMDACAVQTAIRSEFFSRNQSVAGDIYGIQSALKQWMMTDNFIEDVSWYNSVLDRVYSYSAVYTVEEFVQYRMKGEQELSEEALRELFDSDLSHAWICLDPEQGQLLYLTSARVSLEEKNWLVFRISEPVLTTLIRSNCYDSGAACVCLEDGTLLYTSDEELRPAEILGMGKDYGETLLEGQKTMYTRVRGNELVYISVMPKSVINTPLRGLWRMFYMGLLLIALLGAAGIFWVMKMNYKPIQKLENTVLDAQVLESPSNDAIRNVSQAFQKIQQNNQMTMLRTDALSKERAVLGLLMGMYRTVSDFNRDSEGLGLRLEEGNLFIVDVRSQSGEDTEGTSRFVEIVREKFRSRTSLFLEIPENQEGIFIVSGTPGENWPEQIGDSMAEHGLKVRVRMSKICTEAWQLAAAWNSLYGSQLQTDVDGSGFPEELCSILSNAVAFGEPTRITFAIEEMCTSLRSARVSDVRTLLLDTLYLVRSKCRDNKQAFGALDRLRTDIRQAGEQDTEKAERLLRMIGQTVCGCLAPTEGAANPMCQEIEAFLTANYTNPELTVQSVADLFGFSLSNLSHYFKSHVGISVSGYIERLRIHRAQELLKETKMSVTDIAEAVGYSQPATFMRAFKKMTGSSPSAWRNGSEGGREE